jgi:hypothetical protein
VPKSNSPESNIRTGILGLSWMNENDAVAMKDLKLEL